VENSTVLKDTGDKLKTLIKSNIPDLAADNRIILKSPADLEVSSTPLLSLYLYHVTENGYLSNAGLEPLDNGKWRPSPVVLDLYYLLTPYAQDQEHELLILENLIRLFREQAVFDAPDSSGGTTENGLQIRVQRLNLTFEELTRLWERFPQKPYKLSLTYQITPVRVPSGRELKPKEPVTVRKLLLYQDTNFN
jgi:hypothetical protein